MHIINKSKTYSITKHPSHIMLVAMPNMLTGAALLLILSRSCVLRSQGWVTAPTQPKQGGSSFGEQAKGIIMAAVMREAMRCSADLPSHLGQPRHSVETLVQKCKSTIFKIIHKLL